nr:5019_t:CDS:2 [Entrophospora candida]
MEISIIHIHYMRSKELKDFWVRLNDDKSVTVSLPRKINYAGDLDDMDNNGRVCEIPADTNNTNLGKNSLKYFKQICEDCNIGKQRIVNHSIRTSGIMQLTNLDAPFNEIMAYS